jgi:hypothetical protein
MMTSAGPTWVCRKRAVSGEGLAVDWVRFGPIFREALSSAPQNKVTIVSKRHSGNLLAGIQKDSLDIGRHRYEELTVDSYLC